MNSSATACQSTLPGCWCHCAIRPWRVALRMRAWVFTCTSVRNSPASIPARSYPVKALRARLTYMTRINHSVTGSQPSCHSPDPTFAAIIEFGGFSLVLQGDYSVLSVVGSTAHPLWMDMRDEDLFLCPGTGVPGVPPANCTGVEPDGLQANDQNIYTSAVGVP
jgi:hypothetical protein